VRAAPCLFGLDSVVAALCRAPPEAKRSGGVVWPGKSTVTSSDAVTAVGRWLSTECVFPQAGPGEGPEKLPGPLRDSLLAAFSPRPRRRQESASVELSQSEGNLALPGEVS
jgi:hypothetical protein